MMIGGNKRETSSLINCLYAVYTGSDFLLICDFTNIICAFGCIRDWAWQGEEAVKK